MKIVDPHVDVADFYKLNNWTVEDFFSNKSEPWATLPKLKEAEVDVIGLTLYFDQEFVTSNYYNGVKSFYNFYKRIQDRTDELTLLKNSSDLVSKRPDQIGYFLSIEGFECLRDADDFDEFYELGVRSFGFTWSYENKYAHGRHSKNDEGMTSLGLKVIAKMNSRRKVIVDIAHLSERSVIDLEKNYQGMIVSTHSNARSVCNTIHNLTDDEIGIITERGGVVSVFPLTEDTGKNGTFEELYAHIDYIASKWGVDHVAYCSDIYPLPEYPFIENAKDILINSKIVEFMMTKMPKGNVEKIFYGNWIRVLKNSL